MKPTGFGTTIPRDVTVVPPYGHRSPKLSETAVGEIRARYRKGTVSQAELAKYYNVSQNAISAVLPRKTWKDLP